MTTTASSIPSSSRSLNSSSSTTPSRFRTVPAMKRSYGKSGCSGSYRAQCVAPDAARFSRPFGHCYDSARWPVPCLSASLGVRSSHRSRLRFPAADWPFTAAATMGHCRLHGVVLIVFFLTVPACSGLRDGGNRWAGVGRWPDRPPGREWWTRSQWTRTAAALPLVVELRNGVVTPIYRVLLLDVGQPGPEDSVNQRGEIGNKELRRDRGTSGGALSQLQERRAETTERAGAVPAAEAGVSRRR